MARAIMVLGTGSFSGKSLIATALCRVFYRMGYRVAPFKAQNTSLNSSVTANGEEIARAQATQALAACVDPQVEMNPILIKPAGNSLSQLIVLGKPYMNVEAKSYYSDFALQHGKKVVEKALERLDKSFDIIVMEGAGSPAEINLYTKDIANMGAARIAGAKAILVGDIDRGGVFASIYGTVELLSREDRERIGGLIINKFRGDREILNPGIESIERLVGKKVLGVLPYLDNLSLPEEDSMGLANSGEAEVAVIRLPRISNFTDFDPLLMNGVRVKFVQSPEELNSANAVVIPGSKNTIEDLEWLRSGGFEQKLKELSGRKPIMGICAGLQMMGGEIVDMDGVEGERSSIKGLGFFKLGTSFEKEKVLRRVDTRARENLAGRKVRVRGYEIHMGRSWSDEKPLFEGEGFKDGACIAEKKLLGSYLHGVFESRDFRDLFLKLSGIEVSATMDVQKVWEEDIERLASEFERYVDMKEIMAIMGLSPESQP